jgi:hypothetical protein
MADKTIKSNKPKDTFKATDSYKIFMSNKGLLTDGQHEKLLKGESVSLKGVPNKQLKYLITNNLIEGE